MTLEEWDEAIAAIHEEFYEVLVGAADCGAFDGGCVVVAEALREVVGGDLHVVIDREDRAQHAVVLVDGVLWDYDGPRSPWALIDEFDRNELLGGRCIGHRRMRDDDLPEAYRDVALQQRLVEMLRPALRAAPAGSGMPKA